jgi:prepilin-type N-terminal cleavage/methylation domain-containing protein
MQRGIFRRKKGFTLVELIIVIVIIGVLATITTITVTNSLVNARDIRRVTDIKMISDAVRKYNAENGTYPVKAGCSITSGTPNNWVSAPCTGNAGGTNWIPNLEAYLPTLPNDPGPTLPSDSLGTNLSANNVRGYLYISNGTDYKILAESLENANNEKLRSILDPVRDGGDDPAIVDWQPGDTPWSWSYYSAGGASW